MAALPAPPLAGASQHAAPADLLRSADREGPGVGIAGRCVAAADAGAGGNWHDVIPLGGGRLGLVVGDVAGHGQAADAFMAELRGALRAYALVCDKPSDVALHLWRFVATFAHRDMATFVYATFDPADLSLRFFSAAHPAPLVVAPGGAATLAEQHPSGPLALGTSPRLGDDEACLGRGATLVLYTNGLIASRGERPAAGARRLAAVAAEVADPEPAALVEHLVETMLGGARPADGAAILAVRAAPAVDGDLRLTIPAQPERLTGVRRLVESWLVLHGAHRQEVTAIALALHEACANAIEHAYGPEDASFEVTAVYRDGQVELGVYDRGRWRAPRGEDRGRGLDLMVKLVEEVDVEPHDGGTTVRLRHRLALEGDA